MDPGGSVLVIWRRGSEPVLGFRDGDTGVEEEGEVGEPASNDMWDSHHGG